MDSKTDLIDEKALSEALLTLRPRVWKDVEIQVLCGEIPANQLPMKVEIWAVQFRPYLKAAIQAYLENAKEPPPYKKKFELVK